jgi:hypothetical protein
MPRSPKMPRSEVFEVLKLVSEPETWGFVLQTAKKSFSEAEKTFCSLLRGNSRLLYALHISAMRPKMPRS